MILTEINNSFDIDKQTDKGKHGYLDIYERYFQFIKDTKLTLLEIGIWSGASLKLYETYFPNADIIGVDKSLDCVATRCDRAITYQLDQGDKESLVKFSNDKIFDIVIDDGNHYPRHQILSFKILFERMNAGGIYIIEDVHAGYQSAYAGCRGWAIAYFSNLLHDLNCHGDVHFLSEIDSNIFNKNCYDGRIEFINFYPGLIIIKKK